MSAHEKKPNSAVTLVTTEPEEFVDLDPDPTLFGTDDLIGIDEIVPAADKDAQ